MAENKIQQTSWTTNLGRIAGAIGLVLLASTPLTFFLTEEVGVFLWAKVIAACVLVGLYIFTNLDIFGRLAGSRSTSLLLMSALGTLFVIGMVVVLNYLVLQHDHETDVTREGIYTLTAQTTDVLDRLKVDVRVIAFYSSIEADYHLAQDTLERYARHSSHFSFELIDPQQRPDLVEKYNITGRGPRIVLVAGDQEARAKGPSEVELTNGIVKVGSQTEKTVAFVTGHGEGRIDDAENPEGFKLLADAVAAEGYDVRELSLLRAETTGEQSGVIRLKEGSSTEPHPDDKAEPLEIPAQTAVVVLCAPRSMLFEPEVAALKRYLDRGGRVLAMIEPHTDPGLTSLFSDWKIALPDDLIVDPNVMNRLLGLGPAAPMIYAADESHPITKRLTTAVIMFTARSVQTKGPGATGVDARIVLTTDEGAWGETRAEGDVAERDADDHPGPVGVLVSATRHIPSHEANRLTDEGRLLVFGDADWVSNGYLDKPGNLDLFANTINWMASEEERITIGRKTRQSSQVFFSMAQLGLLKFFSLDLLPVLYIAMGLGVVLIRRQK